MTLELLILDSTAVVAILRDTKHLDLLGAVLEVDHDLVIPCSVYAEVSNGSSAGELKTAIDGKRMRVASATSKSDIEGFRSKRKNLNAGEADVILTYKKIAYGGRDYCILDDKRARKEAEKMGVRFTGVMGLLRRMRDGGAITHSVHDEAIGALRKAGFYMPKEA